MKKYKLILLFILLSYLATSQNNLVQNYSFEIPGDTFCRVGAIMYLTFPPWRTPTNGTPDAFKSCTPPNWFSVPYNTIGYQKPRTGTTYAGFALCWDWKSLCPTSYWIEYIQGKLQSKLEANKKYCVSFYVSLADSSTWATDDIGLYFSNTMVSDTAPTSDSHCKNFPYVPQIINPKGNIITDTSNWVLISGIYNAAGGEQYLTIGNFAGDTIDTLHVGNPSSHYISTSGKVSYYYIDDVSVVEIAEAEAGQNKTICMGDTANIGEQSKTGIIYNWTPIAGLSNPSIAKPIASPSITTTYYLIITDTNSVCRCTSRDSVVVSVVGSQYSVSSDKNNLCTGESITLTTSGGINYAWSGGQSSESITVLPTTNTTYTVTVTDTLGCSGTASKTINIINCDTTTNIEVPNVLTPNADNNNDEFKIKYKGEFENFSVKIFNRWGAKIFESQNINFTWDAMTNTGYVIPDGTYYYIISATGKDDKDWELHGAVTVIR